MNEQLYSEHEVTAGVDTEQTQDLSVGALKSKLLGAMAEYERAFRKAADTDPQHKNDEIWRPVEKAQSTVRVARETWVDAITREYNQGEGVRVPLGKYKVEVCFPNREGSETKMPLYPDVNLYQGEPTLADLEAEIRSWISMTGLHNSGLKTDETETAQVAFEAVHQESAVSYQSACVVDSAGHIVIAKKKKE